MVLKVQCPLTFTDQTKYHSWHVYTEQGRAWQRLGAKAIVNANSDNQKVSRLNQESGAAQFLQYFISDCTLPLEDQPVSPIQNVLLDFPVRSVILRRMYAMDFGASQLLSKHNERLRANSHWSVVPSSKRSLGSK